jgi:hypothetical protein
MSTANTTARKVYFQTKSGAESHAIRLARAESPSGLVSTLRYVPGVFQAPEGGAAYEAFPGELDWFVREVPAAELARRAQAGIRREVDRLIEAAEFSAKRASELLASGKPASDCFVRMRQGEVAEYRDRARALETELTVAVARIS